jgi:hypothetical protein
MAEAPYAVYVDLLARLGHGLPLHDPSVEGGVHLGDVGYLQFGRFNKLFNIFDSRNAPNDSKLPDNFEPAAPSIRDDIFTTVQMTSGVLCSPNVNKEIVNESGDALTRFFPSSSL